MGDIEDIDDESVDGDGVPQIEEEIRGVSGQEGTPFKGAWFQGWRL